MMKKLLCLLLGLLLLASPALADDDALLTVQGSAVVTLPADMARVSVGVETSALTVADAVASNAQTIARVQDALIAAGVAPQDLKTENYYVNVNYEYTSQGAPELTGYCVSNTLLVLVRSVDDLGTVIDQAAAAGANQIFGVSFLSSVEAAAYDQALTLAVQEGARKAALLAAAAGKELGRLEALEEGSPMNQRHTVTFDKAAASGTSLIAGDLTVSATVTLTYRLD